MPVDEEFKVDRPFLFMLRHNPTGIWLSIGRLVKPEKRSESTFTSALNNVANNLGSIIVPIEAAKPRFLHLYVCIVCSPSGNGVMDKALAC